MKQGNVFVNFAMVVLTVAVACYLGIYVLDSLNTPYSTAYAYTYATSDSIEAEGWLIREEQPLSAQSGIIDLTREEGEKVGKGQTVALIHRDNRALELQSELDALEQEISLLDYALGQGEAGVSTAHLDETILQSVIDLRGSVAADDYAELEDQIIGLKSQVLKRDYIYEQDLDISQLSQQRKELMEQYSLLKEQAGTATSRVTAPCSGTFSTLVDGYESLLTPELLETLTLAELKELVSQRIVPQNSTGKLITSSKWYLAVDLDEEQAKRLKAGRTVDLAFAGEMEQEIPVEVERIGAVENGRCLVILSTDRRLKETILLRQQRVELIFERYQGLRVPKTSLRMVSKEVTDSETDEKTEESVLGIYTVVGGQAEFKQVEIISEGTDYYVVKSVSNGSRALRAGDEVIVRGVGLFDGKLIEY
jgi:hypothetical protein